MSGFRNEVDTRPRPGGTNKEEAFVDPRTEFEIAIDEGRAYRAQFTSTPVGAATPFHLRLASGSYSKLVVRRVYVRDEATTARNVTIVTVQTEPTGGADATVTGFSTVQPVAIPSTVTAEDAAGLTVTGTVSHAYGICPSDGEFIWERRIEIVPNYSFAVSLSAAGLYSADVEFYLVP